MASLGKGISKEQLQREMAFLQERHKELEHLLTNDNCPACGGRLWNNGKQNNGKQRLHCSKCNYAIAV
jgi:transposase-like protein